MCKRKQFSLHYWVTTGSRQFWTAPYRPSLLKLESINRGLVSTQARHANILRNWPCSATLLEWSFWFNLSGCTIYIYISTRKKLFYFSKVWNQKSCIIFNISTKIYRDLIKHFLLKFHCKRWNQSWTRKFWVVNIILTSLSSQKRFRRPV